MAGPRQRRFRPSLSNIFRHSSSNTSDPVFHAGHSNASDAAWTTDRTPSTNASKPKAAKTDVQEGLTRRTTDPNVNGLTSTRSLPEHDNDNLSTPSRRHRRGERREREHSIPIPNKEAAQVENPSLSGHLLEEFVPVVNQPSSEVVFRDSPVPMRIACRLVLAINNSDTRYHERFVMIRWQEGEDYTLCFDRIHHHVTTQMCNGLKFYLTSRQLRILEHVPKSDLRSSSHEFSTTNASSGTATSFHSLDFLLRRDSQERQLHAKDMPDTRVWQEILPQKLVQQFSESWNARIFIELRVSYTAFSAHKCDNGKPCRQLVKYHLKEMRVFTEVQPQIWFVPGTLLDAYFDKQLIMHLIEIETQASENFDWRASGEYSLDTLAEQTVSFAVRLFALCIYAEVGLDRFFFMYKELKEDMWDAALPMVRERVDHLIGPNSNESNDFQIAQGGFNAHQFDRPSLQHQHEIISDTKVLPFTFQRRHTTQGANGTVYKVQIHEAHHRFLPNRSGFMALKQLTTVQMPPREIISSRTLSALSNRHLTPLLASWTYQDTLYMLFPWAECSLLSLLEDDPSPSLRDNLVEWFLKQTAGLAAAVDQIHNVKRVGLSDKAQHTGWHHDLKPSNILLFSDGMLKISDFGTAQIRERTSRDFRQNQSPTAPYPVGDWDYDAPDYAMYRHISRPYDIFALGCIFVEMLAWLFGKGGHQLKTFKSERLREAEQTPATLDATPAQYKSANFWYRERADHYELKFVVVREIKWLTDRAESKWVLKWLVMLIVRMLTIDAKQRPISAVVSSELRHLHQQAIMDIRNNKPKDQDFFTLDEAPGSRVFGPPSTVGGVARDRSDRSVPHSPALVETLQDVSDSILPSVGLDSGIDLSDSRYRALFIAEVPDHPDIISSGEQFEGSLSVRPPLVASPVSTSHAERRCDSSSEEVYEDTVEAINS